VIFLIPLVCTSCGVKRDPQPLPLPEFDLLRIGSRIYVVPRKGEILPEGFERRDSFFIRQEAGRVCFTVRRLEGGKVLSCVQEAVREKPKLEVRVESERVLVLSKGRFRVYPYRGELVPRPLKEFTDSLVLERGFEEKVYAVTQITGSVESPPVLIRVPPKEPPTPPPPKDLSFAVRGGKIYIYWRSEGEVEGFLVYRNGRLLTQKPVKSHVFAENLPAGEAVYEVVSVNRFGRKSKPATIHYRP